MISIIVATAQDGVIGKAGGIPWHLPSDFAHFKQTTMGHPIVMGRTTFESIGKALPGRRNIVIADDPGYQAEGCEVVGSPEAAIALVKQEPEIFIIGGQSIYEQFLPRAERIYLTRIDAKIPGDRFFKYDPTEWKETTSEKHQKDEKNPYDYEFVTLDRLVK